MPIFEYFCPKCDKDFEILLFGKEKPVCPRCGSKKVNKLLSTVSHKSDSGFTSSQGSACSSCSSGSCSTCGSSS